MALTRTIAVKCGNDFTFEERRANAAFSPGHLLKSNSSNKVLKHATEGGSGPWFVARENSLYGKTIDDAYAADDLAQIIVPARGDIIQMRVTGSVSYGVGDPLISAGDGTLKKLSALGTPTLGTKQVETATVTAASGATSDGNLTVTVTSAIASGSPVAVSVALTTASNSATLVAAVIAAALQANAALAAQYVFTASGATVIATALLAAANDTTLNIAIAAGLGVSAAATSANTTAGVAQILAQQIFGEISEAVDYTATAGGGFALVRAF